MIYSDAVRTVLAWTATEKKVLCEPLSPNSLAGQAEFGDLVAQVCAQ